MKTAWLYDWSPRRGTVNKADGNLPVLVQEAPELGRPYIYILYTLLREAVHSRRMHRVIILGNTVFTRA